MRYLKRKKKSRLLKCLKRQRKHLPKSLKQIGADVFGNCSSDLVIEVPEYSYAAAYCKENGLNYRTVS